MCPHCVFNAVMAVIFGLPFIGAMINWIKTATSAKKCKCGCHKHNPTVEYFGANTCTIQVECDENAMVINPIGFLDFCKLIKSANSNLSLGDIRTEIMFPIKQLGVYKVKNIKFWIVRK